MNRASYAALLLLVGCQERPQSANEPRTVVLSAPPIATAPSSASTRAGIEPRKSGPFRRKAPQHCDRTGIDACAYLGCSGAACLTALLEEKNANARRFMRRMADAASTLSQAGEPIFDWPPHSEFAAFCADKGPCKQKDANGNELDSGYACLTKAESMDRKDRDLTAHARACHCDWEMAQIGVMGGVGPLACDGPDQPVERGKDMPLAEARDVRACAECDAERGPAACNREIDRLRARDRDLARHVEDVHLPRCESE